MSNIIETFQNNVHDTIEDLIDQNSKLNAEIMQCHEVIFDLEKVRMVYEILFPIHTSPLWINIINKNSIYISLSI